MNYSQTPVGYWRGDEVLAWMRNNIPVNNTGFTKLEGTINGYSAYAKRFSEETWTSETNLASNNYTTISVDCGLYYKDLRITITNVAGSTEYLTFSVIQVDGTTVYDFEGDYQMSASSSLTLVSDYELSPGTHSIYLKTVCTYPSKITVYTSVTSVYGIDSNTIELRLYKNNDTTKVFAGGTSSDPLDVIYYGYEPFKNHRLIHDWINDSFASNYYQTIPINLSYGSASIKGGSGLTGWTLTRYNQFAGPWVVGKADDEGNVTWVRGHLLI